jgi:hypothetical protein
MKSADDVEQQVEEQPLKAEEQRPSVWETGVERGRHSKTPELGIRNVLRVDDESGRLICLDFSL